MVKKNSYVTKVDLYKTTQDIIDLIKSVRKELKDDISDLRKELKNDIVTFKDQILTEIIKLPDDMTIVQGWSDRMEDHEVRIEKLEKKTLSS